MYLLAWIVIGAVVGWGAGRVFQGNGYGPLMDILMGIGGGVVGGFLARVAGFDARGGTKNQDECHAGRQHGLVRAAE